MSTGSEIEGEKEREDEGEDGGEGKETTIAEQPS
jgi:hypothetical protein